MPALARRTLTIVALVCALVASAASLSSAAAPAASRDARTVTYPNGGLQVHLGEEAELDQTSRAFRSFVHERLLHLWKLSGGSAKCKPAGTVIVTTWMSEGFARVGEGIYAPCPGGGYSQLYVVRNGSWRAPRALGSQEIRSCSLMRWFEIPGPVADRQCYTDLGDLVAYRKYELPARYSTAGYSARVLATNVHNASSFADAWGSRSVVEQLVAMRDDGAETFTVQRCFGPGDPEYGTVLRKAPRGCLLDVFYGDYRVLAVMRMHPADLGRWTTGSLKVVASS
jgi:hypothetical protein